VRGSQADPDDVALILSAFGIPGGRECFLRPPSAIRLFKITKGSREIEEALCASF
jgi:hypothetical protein